MRTPKISLFIICDWFSKTFNDLRGPIPASLLLVELSQTLFSLSFGEKIACSVMYTRTALILHDHTPLLILTWTEDAINIDKSPIYPSL